MKKALVIYGASTLARLAYYYAASDMGLNVNAFVVDDKYKESDQFLSLPVLGWSDFSSRFSTDNFFVHVAVGYKTMRRRTAIYEKVKAAGYQLINIVARSSYIASNVILGNNNLIMPNVTLEPGTSLGSNNIIWSNTTICHDSAIGSHNFIAANTTVGGEVEVGDGNFLGFSSVILQGRRIGNETLIGAQSLVRSNTCDLHRYYGIPAVNAGRIDKKTGITVS